MIRLQTTDGAVVEVEEKHAMKSVLLRNIMETTGIAGCIPLLVDAETAAQVRAFMETDNHVLEKDYNPLEIYFSSENLSFFDGLSAERLLKVCNAANYLEYPFLLELCCKLIANELSDNSRSELSEMVKGTRRYDEVAVKDIRQEFEWFDDTL